MSKSVGPAGASIIFSFSWSPAVFLTWSNVCWNCFHKKKLQVPRTSRVLQPRYSRQGLFYLSLPFSMGDFESRQSSSASLHPELFCVVVGISPAARCELERQLFFWMESEYDIWNENFICHFVQHKVSWYAYLRNGDMTQLRHGRVPLDANKDGISTIFLIVSSAGDRNLYDGISTTFFAYFFHLLPCVGFHPSSSFMSLSLYHPFAVSSFFWFLRSRCNSMCFTKVSCDHYFEDKLCVVTCHQTCHGFTDDSGLVPVCCLKLRSQLRSICCVLPLVVQPLWTFDLSRGL